MKDEHHGSEPVEQGGHPMARRGAASNESPATEAGGGLGEPTAHVERHGDEPVTELDNFPVFGERFNNAGSDPDGGPRRSGGSANDPHGGYEHPDSGWRSPDPDPVEELVPGGQAGTPESGIQRTVTELKTYTGSQRPNLPDADANDAGLETGRRVQGSGKMQSNVHRGDNRMTIDPETGLPRLTSLRGT